MSTSVQRWLFRRDSYRPAGETIRTADYHVATIGETEAKAFVLTHHYSGTYPSARFRFGLYRGEQLAGVAVFSHPCSDKVLTNVFRDVAASAAVELGRFVLLDEVPGNGETWFLGQAFRALKREGLAGVVSFSDPVPRVDADGRRVFPGHLGTIYQAHNGAYLGRGTPRTLRLLPDGQVLHSRALSKIRSGEKGWAYAAEQLLRAGAPRCDSLVRGRHDTEAVSAWLSTALAATTRTLRHPGNHRYAWGLTPATRRMLKGQPYPKGVAA